ncbi:restriction endonuclease subunit S [Paenibacillus sp. DMB20]|uniref:restriction endonuclease subunit S n=1 Tax=Paenibacillus sp. DMB20 TaxID=1642570 RepID=UPI00069CA716|nr:restriction endonuclease subunit S [Paenibacillus sp. DMB20]
MAQDNRLEDYTPTGWNLCKIGYFFKNLKTGSTPSRSIPSYFSGSIPWITSGELKSRVIFDTKEKITRKAVKDTNLKIYPKGTFFIAITGLEAKGTRGSCAITGIEATTNQSCLAFEPVEGVSNLYIYYWYTLYGDHIAKKYAQGTKQQSLNHKIVEELPILLPPINEQHRITDILTSVDNAISKTEAIVKQTEKVKKGLMQQLLTKGIGHTKFKQTEIGEVPINWNVTTLGEIATITRLAGAEYTSMWEVDPVGPIIALRGFNIGYNTLSLHNVERISQELSDKLGRSKLSKGDIVFPCVGTIGKAAVISEDDSYHINQNIAKITCDIEVDPNYLVYVLMSPIALAQVIKHNTSSSQPNVLVGSLRKFLVPVPPLNEQEMIAETFQIIDSKIRNEKEKLSRLNKLKQGLMQVLLTGKVRVKVNDQEAVTT